MYIFKVWNAYHLLFLTSLLGCEDLLPPVMKKNAYCKKLKLSCLKLKNKCSDALSVAIGNSQNAKKCKKALDELGKENVGVFCTNTCETCGKYHLNTLILYIICYLVSKIWWVSLVE